MKTMSSLVQAVETEALSELADNETSDELTKENEGQANPQSDVMTLPIDAEASSTTTNKRKVLEKLNPSLLNTLNSLLSSPQSIKLVKKPAVSPKRKSISPYKASVDSISPLKSPNAALKSKSKFLCVSKRSVIIKCLLISILFYSKLLETMKMLTMLIIAI